MTPDAEPPAQPARTTAPARLARVRQASQAALALLVAEYVIGMYVNLYVTIPRADHSHSLGTAISNGPAMLTIHAVIGLLLGLAALGVLVRAVIARHLGAIASSVAGLLVLAFASAAGASFTSSGQPSESMAMSVLTGVGLLCYAANLYLLRPPSHRRTRQSAQPHVHD
jgi:hypothetical protein